MQPDVPPNITPKIGTQPRGAVIDTDQEIFETGFDPREYLKTYYPISPDAAKILQASEALPLGYTKNVRLNIKQISEQFGIPVEVAENTIIFDFEKAVARRLLMAYPQGNIEVLDVGGGPTVYQHIAMSLQAGNITHSEFLEENRKEVLKWLSNEPTAYNWDAYFDLMLTILNTDEIYQKILDIQSKSSNEKVRNHVHMVKSLLEGGKEKLKAHLRKILGQKVLHGDVFESDLAMEQQYDVVSQRKEGSVEMLTSNFTIESATGDRKKWEQGMKNIFGKIKNGGFLMLTAIRNADWYAVGEEKMPATKVNEDDIGKFLNQNGFEVIEMRVLEGSDRDNVGYDGMVFVFAQKKG